MGRAHPTLDDLLDEVEDELSARSAAPTRSSRATTSPGTPLALLFYDGGVSVGRIAVMLEYNTERDRAGLVRRSDHIGLRHGRAGAVGREAGEPDRRCGRQPAAWGRPGSLLDLTNLALFREPPLPGAAGDREDVRARSAHAEGLHLLPERHDRRGEAGQQPELSPTQLIPGATRSSSRKRFRGLPVDRTGRRAWRPGGAARGAADAEHR